MLTARFQGFGPQALNFFKALAFHQSKEWFSANRAIYECDVKAPLIELIEALTAEFAARDLALKGAGEKSIFRMNRDIRFSKDKSPYKTHAGAVLTRDGSKNAPGLFYIHIAPEGSFAAAGFYRPEAALLAAIRSAIASAQDRWLAIEHSLAAAGLELSSEDRVTRLPKGFDPKQIEAVVHALRLKSFIVRKPLPPKSIFSPRLPLELADFAETSSPLLNFGWAAIEMAPR